MYGSLQSYNFETCLLSLLRICELGLSIVEFILNYFIIFNYLISQLSLLFDFYFALNFFRCFGYSNHPLLYHFVKAFQSYF